MHRSRRVDRLSSKITPRHDRQVPRRTTLPRASSLMISSPCFSVSRVFGAANRNHSYASHSNSPRSTLGSTCSGSLSVRSPASSVGRLSAARGPIHIRDDRAEEIVKLPHRRRELADGMRHQGELGKDQRILEHSEAYVVQLHRGPDP